MFQVRGQICPTFCDVRGRQEFRSIYRLDGTHNTAKNKSAKKLNRQNTKQKLVPSSLEPGYPRSLQTLQTIVINNTSVIYITYLGNLSNNRTFLQIIRVILD